MSREKVLIIDDDATLSDLLQLTLDKKGYTASTAATGETGLNEIKKEKPDLVILDIMMPGMNGYQVLERLKTEPYTQDIRVIMLTGKREEGDFDRALEKKADWYVNKPFNMDYLLRIIEVVLKKPK
jgi:DNA-binding response OmpR family regulator